MLLKHNLSPLRMKHCFKPEHKLKVKQIDILKEATLWDSFFTESNHHLRSEFLAFYMQNTSVRSHFFQLFEQGRVVGQLYLQSTVIPSADLLDYTISATNWRFLPACWLNGNCNLEFLVCGNVFKSNQAGYALLPEIAPSEAFQSLIEFLESEENTSNFIGLLVKDCPSEVQPFRRLLPYKKDITMQLSLNVKWLTIQDYVADLDKKYRNRYKKITKNFEGLTFTELSVQEIERYSEQIYALYLGVTKKQNFKFGELSKQYFLEKKRLLNERFKVFAVFKETELIAFSSHIMEPNQQMEIHYIGFDYRYNETHNLYFNILFHGLQEAIQNRFVTLELGRTAEVAKASLGAKPHYKLNYLYFRKNLYQLSFRLITKFFKTNWEMQLRNPFSTKAAVN